MKFLCPSCKAKYQIADEKVIGRTVKMKCRQCGHVIEINEAVIGDVGLPDGAPSNVSSDAESPSVGDSAPLARTGSKGRPPPKPVRSPTPPGGMPAVTGSSVSPTPASRRAAVPLASGTRSPQPTSDRPRLSAVPAPRPAPARSGIGSPPTVTVAATTSASENRDKSEGAISASSRGPLSERALHQGGFAPPMVDTSAPPGAVGRLPGVPEVVVSSLSVGASRPAATKQDALAGAFARAVADTTTQAQPVDHPLAGDEWYVGINEQPVGPIRLTEIRDRAAKGEVTPDCLVWRDGFEDWKPLTTFPELVAVVEEGIASRRSLRPPPAGDHGAGVDASVLTPSHPGKSADWQQPSHSAGVAALPRSPTAPIDDETLAVAGLTKPKIPMAAWFAIAMALVLGVTIGLVVMKPEPPKEVVKYVEVPVSAKSQGGENPPPAPLERGAPNSEAANGDNSAITEKRNAAGMRRSIASGTAEGPGPAPSSDVSQGLKGLQGLQGLGAPRTGPASEVGASSAGRQQLDSATLSRTVSRYTASVKRSCWQPALDTRAPDAATSARISANIVVAPSGKVQTVTVSPDPKGYRGLSSCIQARVRNWEFPPAGGPTEFNVPFVFAAQ